MVTENLKSMSPSQLAMHQSGFKERTHNDILCEKEWHRRFMIEQHELDKKLMLEQVKWMKVSILSGLLGIIAGSLITGFATMESQQKQEAKQVQSLKSQALQQTVDKTLSRQTETNEIHKQQE